MKTEYRRHELEALSFHDSQIRSIRWEKDGDDLVLGILWLPPQRDAAVDAGPGLVACDLCAEYVTDLVISLDYGQGTGQPYIYEVRIMPLERDRWKLLITFIASPDGEIVFECNDLMLRVVGHSG